MFYVQELMFEIKSQSSFNLKSEWTWLLMWPQMRSLTIFLNKISNTNLVIPLFT